MSRNTEATPLRQKASKTSVRKFKLGAPGIRTMILNHTLKIVTKWFEGKVKSIRVTITKPLT